MNEIKQLLIFSLFFIPLTGCNTPTPVVRVYKGPKQSLQNIAVLVISRELSVTKIDNKDYTFAHLFGGSKKYAWVWESAGSYRYCTEYHLLPGVHEITAHYHVDYRTGGSLTVSHDFTAGHVYELRAWFDKTRLDEYGLIIYDYYSLEILHRGTIEEFAAEEKDTSRLPKHWHALAPE